MVIYFIVESGLFCGNDIWAILCHSIWWHSDGYRKQTKTLFFETHGHVFQLHFTNSTSMIEKGYITETVGDWTNGDVHFGFNISRVFTLKRK